MKLLLLTILIFFSCLSFSQDTFSIVAVDTITGEIGSAGASCIDETQIQGGAIIISDIIPGRGAIHTQSYWNTTNQQNAHARMLEGLNPQEIIDWLAANDAQNNPTRRQYGIVDFDLAGNPRSAGFTGTNCLDYKNHITGPNYAIQGNILLGPEILDSIEARFLNTPGSLPEKLMAALQGANVPGADSRCLENGTSSLSAFIRVAWPSDTNGTFYLDINVPSVPEGMEPIDSLQILFDQWLNTVVGIPENIIEFRIYPNPARDYLYIQSQQNVVGGMQSNFNEVIIAILDLCGRKVLEQAIYAIDLSKINISSIDEGLYIISIINKKKVISTQKLLITRL